MHHAYSRNIDEIWFEMTCTLNIDADNLKHPVAYKYIVCSPKMEKEDDCYEYLHGYDGNPNRCMRIPQNKFPKYGGMSVCLYVLCNKAGLSISSFPCVL